MPRSKKKWWPTMPDGTSATVEQIRAFIEENDRHFNTPAYPTDCHFCQYCTRPLEFEPCPCCRTHRWEPFREKLIGCLP